MPNILDDLAAHLARIEAKLDAVQTPVPVVSGDSIWADGGMVLSVASAFSGLSRTELYALMRSGELPYAQPTRDRVVPRRWLVQYLESKQHAREPLEVA